MHFSFVEPPVLEKSHFWRKCGHIPEVIDLSRKYILSDKKQNKIPPKTELDTQVRYHPESGYQKQILRLGPLEAEHMTLLLT